MIVIEGVQYKASRLAWLLMSGEWPPGYLDHVNGIRDDDRLCNLREATPADNSANKRGYSSTGIKGVYLHPDGSYQASIMRHGRQVHLGRFRYLTDAISARRLAALGIHGEFAFEAR
jgi:hypothetical protein